MTGIEVGILVCLFGFALIAIWLIVQGVYVVREGGKGAQKGTVTIRAPGDKGSLHIAGPGGIILVGFGVLLVAFIIFVLLWMRQNRAVKAQLSVVEARYAALSETYRALKQEHTELLADLQKLGSLSGPDTAQQAMRIRYSLGKAT